MSQIDFSVYDHNNMNGNLEALLQTRTQDNFHWNKILVLVIYTQSVFHIQEKCLTFLRDRRQLSRYDSFVDLCWGTFYPQCRNSFIWEIVKNWICRHRQNFVFLLFSRKNEIFSSPAYIRVLYYLNILQDLLFYRLF